MTSALDRLSIHDVLHDVRVELQAADLKLPVLDLDAAPTVDGLGEEAWTVRLFLPRPTEDTWDVDELFETRRMARQLFEAHVAGSDIQLPGHTIVTVTTAEATEDQLASETAPEPGEDPDQPVLDEEL